MNYTQSRKTHKSSQNQNAGQRMSTTLLNTPSRQIQTQNNKQKLQNANKQCPYHFNQPQHVCLTCRRSICLRCAITYCQQHTIHSQSQILPLLLIDLQKLTIQPRIQEVQLQLKQSQQRQEYISRKISKILTQIQENFEYIKQTLERKKQQIIQHFHLELANGYLGQYKKFDDQLFQKLDWLKQIAQNVPQCRSIQEIDRFASLIKESGDASIFSSKSKTKTKVDKKIQKMLTGKQKLKIHKIWSQEKLERVLYEIENINYKISDNSLNHTTTKKKRVITEASEQNNKFNSSMKSPFGGIINSTSNSKFPTGRKFQ